MSIQPDIAISTASGRQLAIVEVKNLPQLSLAQAVDVRDSLLEDLVRRINYVLVVSQTKGFIWQRQGDERLYGEAEELDMRPVLREYLSEGELSQHIRGAELELVLSHWLGDLARGHLSPRVGTQEQGPFLQFISDIRGAQIQLQALA